MSLHIRVSRVDDYAGELTQALQKLESEQAQGALNRAQQEDFLADLRKAVEVKDLRPMRTRALGDLLLSALSAAAAAALSCTLGLHQPVLVALLVLCALGLGMSIWRYRLYLSRQRHDRRWLGRLEAAVAAGGTIFDPETK